MGTVALSSHAVAGQPMQIDFADDGDVAVPRRNQQDKRKDGSGQLLGDAQLPDE